MKNLLKLTVFTFSIFAIAQAEAAITTAAQCAAYAKQQNWPMQWRSGQCVNMGGVGPAIPVNGWNGGDVGPEIPANGWNTNAVEDVPDIN
jgi:hypothetical protein